MAQNIKKSFGSYQGQPIVDMIDGQLKVKFGTLGWRTLDEFTEGSQGNLVSEESGLKTTARLLKRSVLSKTEEQKLINKKNDIIKRVRSKIISIQKVKSKFVKGASDGK